MTLYLLKPIETGIVNPWLPWYDKAFGFVVRAESEVEAREIADKHAGDENTGADWLQTEHPWLSPVLSSCHILTSDGPAGMILRDFASA